MSDGVRIPLMEAAAIGFELRLAMLSACDGITIAGSIRRRKPDVGDIELVAIPRYATVPDGMFGTSQANLLTERVNELILDGVLGSHPTDPKRGPRYSKLIHRPSGMQVDLFSASAETLGIILLIRTGPADYSQRFVTDMRRRGFHVAGGELHRGGLGCGAYVCPFIPTPDEAAVYRALGLPFVAPEDRT